jgi:broad specificity phosphatase PhoE
VVDGSPPASFVLVRHGETEWSASGRHTGITDLPLTEHGRAEASVLGAVLRAWVDPDEAVTFTSSRQRATTTAALALPTVTPVISDDLGEVGYGDYEGLTSGEIAKRRPTWELFHDGCPNGEPIAAASERADRFIGDATELAQGRPVVAFTHGHFSRLLAVRLLGLDAVTAAAFVSDTASVGVVTLRRGAYVLSCWNLTARLVEAAVNR